MECSSPLCRVVSCRVVSCAVLTSLLVVLCCAVTVRGYEFGVVPTADKKASSTGTSCAMRCYTGCPDTATTRQCAGHCLVGIAPPSVCRKSGGDLSPPPPPSPVSAASESSAAYNGVSDVVRHTRTKRSPVMLCMKLCEQCILVFGRQSYNGNRCAAACVLSNGESLDPECINTNYFSVW